MFFVIFITGGALEGNVALFLGGVTWQSLTSGQAYCVTPEVQSCFSSDEEVDLSEYLDYHDAYQQLGSFLNDVYTHN